MFLAHRTRRAFSLTEVLIAIFVMAIGMISLLVLFIIGLQNARWGLDNGRLAMSVSTGQSESEVPHVIVAASNIVGVSSRSLRNDWVYAPDSGLHMWRYGGLNAYVAPIIGRPDFLVHNVSGTWTFDERVNPLGIIAPLQPNTTVVEPPVFVDPQASARWFVQAPNPPNPPDNYPYHVGTNASASEPLANIPTPIPSSPLRPSFSLGIARATISNLGFSLRDTLLGTSLADEVAFGNDAAPGIYAGNIPPTPRPYTRDNRFSWAYLCNWPNYDKSEICDVTMVAFNGRPDGGGVSPLPAGEVNYISRIETSLDASIKLLAINFEDATHNFGRLFVKGSTSAVVYLPNGTPMAAKAGDWIFDNTFILPEYDPANVITVNGVQIIATAPFLDRYHPLTVATFTGGNPLRPGLCGGHFYKIIGITDVQTTGTYFYQVLTLDRPACSDGFVGTMITGIADIIEKSVGRMPAR